MAAGPPIELQGVARTLLLTVYLRACDARSKHPLLGDQFAVDLVDRLDVDSSTYARGRGNAPLIAARGAILDRWTAAFLRTYPHGQVLHLGCGLDSRPLRVERPATSRWIDIDQPDVMALRQQVYVLPEEIVSIGASVGDGSWWSTVEASRPTLLVAEGLLMYLPRELELRLIAWVEAYVDAPTEAAFDTIAPWMVRLSDRSRLLARADVRFQWAREDLTIGRPERTILDDVSVVDTLARAPLGRLPHTAYRTAAKVPFIREGLRVQRLALAS